MCSSSLLEHLLTAVCKDGKFSEETLYLNIKFHP